MIAVFFLTTFLNMSLATSSYYLWFTVPNFAISFLIILLLLLIDFRETIIHRWSSSKNIYIRLMWLCTPLSLIGFLLVNLCGFMVRMYTLVSYSRDICLVSIGIGAAAYTLGKGKTLIYIFPTYQRFLFQKLYTINRLHVFNIFIAN